jgi:uncharacterized protein
VATVLLAVGLVLVVEGLAVALAPSRLDEMLAYLARTSQERRRIMGLSALGIGTALIALSKVLGGP